MDFIYSMQLLFNQAYLSIPQPIINPTETNPHKRGRKALDLTVILSEFYSRSKKDPPRREYIRCSILRKMLKFIRLYFRNKLKPSIHPFYQELINLIQANEKEVKKLTAKERLPYVENKSNHKFKSYNNEFCKSFLSSSLMWTVFIYFVEYLFACYSFQDLQKALGIYCCKGLCLGEHECRSKYEKVKSILYESF